MPRREVYGKQEYDFHVYKELMWGEEAGARPRPLCPAAAPVWGLLRVLGPPAAGT